MPFTHTITQSVAQAPGGSLTYKVSSTGDAEDNRTIIIPDATTDQQVYLTLVTASLLSIFVGATRTVTVKTNSTSIPDDTFVFEENVPFMWTSQWPTANPFSADVVTIYVTNASGFQAQLDIRILVDSTP